MSDDPPSTMGKTFRYTTIGCEILIFALVGWIIGPYIFPQSGDIIGALIGALIGTLMMFCTLFYIAGLFGRRREPKEKREDAS
ncbi:MAG: hypothetical protein ACXADB_05425 [Candidatus Hermodarchaeia archaeon]|jgi:uncharacterized membrane protein